MKIPTSPYIGKSKRALDALARDQVATLPAFEAKADEAWQKYVEDKRQLTVEGVLLGLISERQLPEMDLKTALFMHDRYTKEFYSNAEAFTEELQGCFSSAQLEKWVEGWAIFEGLQFAKQRHLPMHVRSAASASYRERLFYSVHPDYADAIRKSKATRNFMKSHYPVAIAYSHALESAKVEPERWSGAIFLNAYRTGIDFKAAKSSKH